MKRIGCIVMYSKPVDKNKTIPCGTVYYVDGTEEEVSLKEAAEKALDMSLDYGYENAIENERYFNTTYEEFINNKDKYRSIANPDYKKEPRKMTVKTTNMPKKLSDNIKEVEPPKVVKDETNKEPDIIKDLIDNELDNVEASNIKEKEKIDELVNNHQEETSPILYEFFDESELNKLTQEEKDTLNNFLEEYIEKIADATIDTSDTFSLEDLIEKNVEDIAEKDKIVKIFDKLELEDEDINVNEPEQVEDDIDFSTIEQKLNEVIDNTTEEENEYTEEDLIRMINEQNKKVEENNKKR